MKELHIKLYKENNSYFADIIGADSCADCFKRPASGFPCDLGNSVTKLWRAQQELLKLKPDQNIDVLKGHWADLYNFLHGPPLNRNALSRFWWECFELSQNEIDRGLRTVLHIDTGSTGPALAAAPWELMCDEAEQFFAAMRHDFPHTLVRVCSSRQGHGSLKPIEQDPTRPLRVLIVIGHAASDDTQVMGSNEALHIDQALFKLLPWQVELCVLIRPPLRELTEWCERWQPHVFHFIGHGICLGNARGCTPKLLLRQDSPAGGAAVSDIQIGAAELADLFKGRLPRLIVLNACRSGQAGDAQEGGMAELNKASQVVRGFTNILIQRGVMAVVAIQADIRGDLAVQLMRSFYTALIQGKAIDVALTEARIQVKNGQSKSLDWSLPALYLAAEVQAEEVIRLAPEAAVEQLRIFEGLAPERLQVQSQMLSLPLALRAHLGSKLQQMYLNHNKLVGGTSPKLPHISLLTGESGTGKTTLMYWLAEYCTRRNQPYLYADCGHCEQLTLLDILRLIRDGALSKLDRGIQLANKIKPDLVFNRFNYECNIRGVPGYAAAHQRPPAEGEPVADELKADFRFEEMQPLRADEDTRKTLTQFFWDDLTRLADQGLVLLLDHLSPLIAPPEVERIRQLLFERITAAESTVRLVLALTDGASGAGSAHDEWLFLSRMGSDEVLHEYEMLTLPGEQLEWLARLWARRYFVYLHSSQLHGQYGVPALTALLNQKKVTWQQVDHWVLRRQLPEFRNDLEQWLPVTPGYLVSKLTSRKSVEFWLRNLT